MEQESLEDLIEQARQNLQTAEAILEQAEGREYVRRCHKAVRLCSHELDRLVQARAADRE